MCGNRAQDTTKSHTRTEDAQDAQDANWTSLASGCKADVSDAPYIFADVAKCSTPPRNFPGWATGLFQILPLLHTSPGDWHDLWPPSPPFDPSLTQAKASLLTYITNLPTA